MEGNRSRPRMVIGTVYSTVSGWHGSLFTVVARTIQENDEVTGASCEQQLVRNNGQAQSFRRLRNVLLSWPNPYNGCAVSFAYRRIPCETVTSLCKWSIARNFCG